MELQSFGKKENRYSYYYSDDSKSNSFADTLSKYQVVKKPYGGTWICLGRYKNQIVKGGDSCSGSRGDEVTCNGYNGSDVTAVAKGRIESSLHHNDVNSDEAEYEV